ncbi:MAG: putative toxin-antitoxin system toxin component, PIN family [Bryobacteraceae bacterium]
MVRVTVDSNIWISSFNFRGKPRKLIDLAEEGAFQIQISEPIVVEVLRVLKGKFEWHDDILHGAEADMNDASHKVVPQVAVDAVRDDPDDNRILECALESKSDYIVTGDKDLLRLKSFKGIPIIRASEFLDALQGRGR